MPIGPTRPVLPGTSVTFTGAAINQVTLGFSFFPGFLVRNYSVDVLTGPWGTNGTDGLYYDTVSVTPGEQVTLQYDPANGQVSY